LQDKSLFDVPHGVANALLLPTVMEFNMDACLDKYPKIAEALGVDISGMTKEEASREACEAVRRLALAVGIPQHLSELGISESDIPLLSEQALADVCTPGNPRDVTLDQIMELYKKVL